MPDADRSGSAAGRRGQILTCEENLTCKRKIFLTHPIVYRSNYIVLDSRKTYGIIMTVPGSEEHSKGNSRGFWAHRSHSADGSDKVEATATSAGLVTPGRCNRQDFPIDRHRVALLIIDLQDLLCDENKRKGITEVSYLFHESLPSALPNVEILLSAFRHVKLLEEEKASTTTKPSGRPEIIFTYLEALTEDCRDISMDYKLSGPNLTALLPTPSKPAIFLPNITPKVDEIRIPKTSCSVFLSTNINYVLRNLNVEHLVLCGQITNKGVESTCRDAADLGYFVTVAHDACAAHSLQEHQQGLSNMNGFARVVDTKQVVRELSGTSVMYPLKEHLLLKPSNKKDYADHKVDQVSHRKVEAPYGSVAKWH